ncbi:MAG TPA: heme exporter protein CcmB [Gemmatimonadaceae bacterium]
MTSLTLDRARAIFWKDMVAERRTRTNFNAVVFFAVLMLLLFGFALGPDADALRKAAVGAIWLSILFSGVLSFNRSYAVELESNAMEQLLLYPGDRRAIFLGKLAANLAFVALTELIVVPMAAILYNVEILPRILPLLGVLALGTIGFVTLGTFYAAMAARVRAREVLLPLLLFPMLVPLLLAAVECTKSVLMGDLMGDWRAWVKLLVAFDVIFLAAALVAFEHIIED